MNISIKKTASISILAIYSLLLSLAFQNCSGKFQTKTTSLSNLQSFCTYGEVQVNNCTSEISNSFLSQVVYTCDESRTRFIETTSCSVISCDSGFHVSNNQCVADNGDLICNPNAVEKIDCTSLIENSKAAYFDRTCDEFGKSWILGECTLSTCNDGYQKDLSGLNCQLEIAKVCTANQTKIETCTSEIANSTLAEVILQCNDKEDEWIRENCLVKSCDEGYVINLTSNKCDTKSCEGDGLSSCTVENGIQNSGTMQATCSLGNWIAPYSTCKIETNQDCLTGFEVSEDKTKCLEAQKGELIYDNSFNNGFKVKNPSGNFENYTLDPTFKNGSPLWEVIQWFSKSSIGPSGVEISPSIYKWSNNFKSISLGKANTIDESISMYINAENEFSGVYRKSYQPWPHLLLEQRISPPGSPGPGSPSVFDMESLTLSLDAILIDSNQIKTTGYSSSIHASQFNLYLIVQNLNRSSSGFGDDYVWFGIPIYDDRYQMVEHSSFIDAGTNRLTWQMSYSSLATQSMHSKNWVHLEADLLPQIKAALQRGFDMNILRSKKLADYKIGGISMGYEIPGRGIVTIKFKNLSLKYK